MARYALGMIYINEWFPNPIGNDAAGEFIELYNNSAAAASLNGYELSDGAKKKFSLAGYVVPANGYLVLKKAQDKFSLKNTDGGLLLYGPGGQVVDEANFFGAAPQGKSFARVDYGTAPIEHFAFEYPTPGAVNKKFDTSVATQSYPFGVSLTRPLGAGGFLTLLLATASSFLVFFIYVARNNRNVSHFLFGRDEKSRP